MAELLDELKTTLGAAYSLERELGGGGMSRVFLARDVALARRVVIKVLPPELAAGVSTDRFRREILLAARLQHPHIVPLLSAGELPDGTLYYTMPFVEGESLRARVQRARPSSGQALRWLRDVASALAHAHAQGIVHRDMKPDNVLLSDGYAVVTDFGIAKALSSATHGGHGKSALTSVGIALGTPAYMAPEQVAGEDELDHRVDLYALGVIAYELFTGQTPFDGKSMRAILTAHLMTPPPPLRDRRPDLDERADALVMRCLEKEPADRPRSAAEVVTVLEELLHAPGVLTEAPGTSESVRPARSPVWRNLLGFGTTLAAAAVVAAIAIVMRDDRAPTPGRIAVATFRDASPNAVLRETTRDIAQDVAAALGTIDSADVVAREETERAESQLPAASERPGVLAGRLHAMFVVTGTVTPLGDDSVSVRARIIAAPAGETVGELAEVRARRAELRDALEPMRARLAGATMILTSSMFGRAMLPAGEPPTLAAVRAVREGLRLEAALASPDPGEDESVAELVRFDRAVVADPQYVQARLWFASAALRRFGGEALADSALVLVEAQQERLTSYEHALLDALRADVGGNHELALRGWRRARDLAPSWPNRWWLAMTLRDADRPREARTLLDSLGSTNAHFLRSAPGLYHYLGDYAAEYRALRDEGRRAPATVQSLGFQQALLQSLAALDSGVAVTRALENAPTLPAEAGTSVAYLLTRTSWELGAHGHAAAADSALVRAVAWCGNRTAMDLRNPSVAYDCMEALSLARRTGELAALAGPAMRERQDDIAILGVLGLAAALAGDRELAGDFSARVAKSVRVDGSRGLAWWVRGRIAAALGDSATAVDFLRDAFARGAGWSQRADLHRDPAFALLRGYAPFEQLRRPQG